MEQKKRFSSEKSATSFAKKVNGKVKDLRHIKGAKSKFKVTYDSDKQIKSHKENFGDWSPEEDRDFGYPNDFWK